MTKKSEFVLASYVTYKELYNSKKYRSQYQILSEFIKHIICSKDLFSFSVSELNEYMSDMFGFNVPYAVIKTSLKKTDGIKNNGKDNYTVDRGLMRVDSSFEKYNNEAIRESNSLLSQLNVFAESRLCKKFTEEEKQQLLNCFMAYLLDDSNGGEFQECISTFILNCEQNQSLKRQLQYIREGCILYTGITYDINETGSVTKPITLFLDTEVLFDLLGYNGELYKTLSCEMLKIVNETNRPNKKISVKYFAETKNEILEFFRKAEDIVSKREPLKPSIAMETIVNGCSTVSDVIDKKSDFFYKLENKYGIYEDLKKDYYSTNLHKYNLEDSSVDDFDLQKSMKYISHINKLRGDYQTHDYLQAKFIFVTETTKTIEQASLVAEEIERRLGSKYAHHAVRMSNITNILWYKTNKGFGTSEFPSSVDAIVKAKLVLSSYISQNVGDAYDRYKTEYINNEITEEQFVARTIVLKNKNVKPEDISLDNVDNDINFSESFLQKYEEEHNLQKTQLRKKDKTIKEKDLKIQTQEKELLSQQQIIKNQEEELAQYRSSEEHKKKNKERRRRICKAFRPVLFSLVVIVIVIIFSIILIEQSDDKYKTLVVIIIPSIASLITIMVFIKQGLWKKIKELITVLKKH